MTDDRAQAAMDADTPFMTVLITAIIVALIIMDLATDIGQSTDLNARLAGASLALFFGSMLLSVIILTWVGPEVTTDD